MILLTLIVLQSNALALAMTFVDDHRLSIKQYNGDAYLVLGHGHHHHHDHQHNHQRQTLKQNTSQGAKLLNHHSHEDHLIKLPGSSNNNILTTSQQNIDFDYQDSFDYQNLSNKQFVSLMPNRPMPLYERYRCYKDCQTYIHLKNIVQFLV